MGQMVSAGILGGLAGGLLFGALMAMMGMLPMIASLVGSSSAGVGFGVHLVISVVIALGLVVLLGHAFSSYGRGALIGLIYGALWWVLGPLLIMPLMMGMPVFVLDATALWSLMGHLIYGLILGVVVVAVLNRRR
ncbi:membrane protein [Nesterenkonia sp. AN1]|nr:membrane protein [Nesterenkonia sp. AN1]